MKKVQKIGWLLIICAACGMMHAVARPISVDSLKVALSKSEDPHEHVDIYNLLGIRYYRSNPDSAKYFVNKAMSLAREVNYNFGEAESYRVNGLILHNTGLYEESLEELDTAIQLFRKLGDSSKVGMSYKQIGWIHMELGSFPVALNYYSRANQIADDFDDNYLKGQVLNNIGVLMALIGEFDSAMAHLMRSVEITSNNGDPLIGLTYTNIGLVKSSLGDYESAETYFLKGLELDMLNNQDWGVANAFENIGELKLNQGKLEEAQEHFEKARDQFVRLKEIKGVAVNDNFLGVIQLKKGNYQQALEKLDNAYQLYMEINYQRGMAKVLRDMANCQLLRGNKDEAVELATKSLKLANDIGQIPEAALTAETLHGIYAEMGDVKKAYEQIMIYLAYKDSLYKREKIEYVTQVEAKYKMTQIQQENELLLKDNQLKLNELNASKLKLERQEAIQIALAIGLLCAILTAAFWYRFYLKKQKTIKLLERLNDEIVNQKEQIASQASELEKVNSEMQHMNDSLEVLVRERTKKIEDQNKKLRDYAFSNSHEVRAPLSNLLGLINVTKLEGLSPEEQEEIIEKIYISALDLDSVITKVNKILEDEGL